VNEREPSHKGEEGVRGIELGFGMATGGGRWFPPGMTLNILDSEGSGTEIRGRTWFQVSGAWGLFKDLGRALFVPARTRHAGICSQPFGAANDVKTAGSTGHHVPNPCP